MDVMRALAWLAVAAACGGGGGGPPPDGPPSIPDGAVADAASDGPSPASPLAIDTGSGVVADWTFPDTRVGQTAAITLFVVNRGATATGPLALSMTGADAADFAVDPASTCGGASLVPGDLCRLRLAFAPTAAAARHAVLRVDGGSVTLAFPVTGTGLGAPAPGLEADPGSLDFGVGEVGRPGAPVAVLIRNSGTSNVALGRPIATAPFAVDGHDCPATLTPGGACTVQVVFAPTAIGAVSGSLTVTDSPGALDVALSGVGMRVVSVGVGGDGAGVVTSVPTGIDCGTTCSGLFFADVTLTATPAAGDRFAGWSYECGTATTCTLSRRTSEGIAVYFASASDKAIAVTFAGGAPGKVDVRWETSQVGCMSSCTTYVPAGTHVDLDGDTPSTFGGWTGDCVATTRACNLGTVINDRAVTVTFTPDEREVRTLLLPIEAHLADYAPGGDLIVAGDDTVTRLTPSGEVVWSTRIGSAGALDLETSAAGDIYFLQAGALHRLSPAGILLSTVDVPVRACGERYSFPNWLSIAPNGDVAVLGCAPGTELHVLAADGAPRWSKTGLRFGYAVAVDPTGIVAVAVDDGDNAEGLRFDAAGNPLGSLGRLPGHYHTSMTYDAVGYLVGHSTGFSYATVSRVAPDGMAVFAATERINASGYLECGAAVASTGDVVAARELSDYGPGMTLQVFAPSGTPSWTHVKEPGEFSPYGTPGVMPRDLTTDGAKHIAVIGRWTGWHATWIQIYALP